MRSLLLCTSIEFTHPMMPFYIVNKQQLVSLIEIEAIKIVTPQFLYFIGARNRVFSEIKNEAFINFLTLHEKKVTRYEF